MSDEPNVIYLKDYKQPDYWIKNIDLTFELGEEETVVSSVLKVEKNDSLNHSNPLVLMGEDLTIKSIELNGDVLNESDYKLDDKTLTVLNAKNNCELKIVTVIKPQENTKLEGLYKSSGNFCTQCEAEGFRRITYYLDRPDVMAIFTSKVIADKTKYPVLLSNGNPVESGDLPDGKHFVKWFDPFKKPSYLFALVAGELSFIESFYKTISGRKVQCRIYVEKENIDQCQHALDSLIHSMKWDEDRFGREYDLDIYNVVAVNDFNMGAMENKGLNVFNSKYVLAKPETATDLDFIQIEAVIGHEYFHNWTGNRITCRDWFQLSLKEGLTVFRDQEFTSDRQSRSSTRIQNVNILRNAQFPEDSGPMAHSVRPDSYAEINNFYTSTIYNKGSEVIRMIYTLLGKTVFRKATDLYFERHDGQAVTIDDFAQCMQDASGVDLTLFKNWYCQAGTPVVEVKSEYDSSGKIYKLHFKQSCPATPGQDQKNPFHIPVKLGLLDEVGNDLELKPSGGNYVSDGTSIIYNLMEQEQTLEFTNIEKEPTPSLFREFSSPIKLVYEYSDEELAFLMSNDNDEFNQWEASQNFALRIILKNIDHYQNNNELEINENYLKAIDKIITNDSMEDDIKANALMIPSMRYIGELMPEIDVDAAYSSREFLIKQVANASKSKFLELYHSCKGSDVYELNNQAIGQRSLKNGALSWLMSGSSPEIELCFKQYNSSSNMTDELAAIGLIVDHDCNERSLAIEGFYNKWKNDVLVLNKWLALQGGSKIKGNINNVKNLMSHESFEIKNPNKVRSLLGSFFAGSYIEFHAIDGSGYQFLSETILKLDQLNPQVSARMVSGLIGFKKFKKDRADLMKAELEKIQNSENVSADVMEIVNNSLK
ncbi:MAG: aminopeptidase N [Planctomycetota bacterium]|nr:MAG: aminopeptidase N [Planctomycetota bacterium]